MQDLKLKLPPGELARHRRVWVSARKLSAEQKKAFKETPVEVLFSTTFLGHARKELKRTEPQLRNSGERAKNALILIGVHTVEQMIARPYEELAIASGMGPAAMALALDLVTLFGFQIKGVPPEAGPPAVETENKADELAEALGLSTS